MKKIKAMIVGAIGFALAVAAFYVIFEPRFNFLPPIWDKSSSAGASMQANLQPPEPGIRRTAGQNTAMRPLVVAKAVVNKVMNDRLTAIGTGRAQSTVDLTPWSSGVLTEFYVKAGDLVNKGDPVARLDSDNEEIALERARIELDDAQAAYERIARLSDSETASKVQLINAELALARAQLALRDSELALARRTIRAPQSGIVGILPVDVGNYVTASTPIARIDDQDKILIDIWVPERFAPLVRIGQPIEAEAIARSGTRFEGHISAIDTAVDEVSRTLRVRCEITNKDDHLRAGMSFKVSLTFAGDQFASVDPLAIQWNAQGAYVWRLNDNKTQIVPVTIIQRTADSVLVDGDLTQDEMVVVQGVQNLRAGGEVMLRQK